MVGVLVSAPSRTIIIGVIGVPAFRSLEALTPIGIVTPGDVRVISLTLCASITRSRRKRPGGDYTMGRSCRWWGGRGGPKGEELSLALVGEESPCPLCALFQVPVWGVVVRPGGCGGEDARRGSDPADAASPPGLPLTLISVSHTSRFC